MQQYIYMEYVNKELHDASITFSQLYEYILKFVFQNL